MSKDKGDILRSMLPDAKGLLKERAKEFSDAQAAIEDVIPN